MLPATVVYVMSLYDLIEILIIIRVIAHSCRIIKTTFLFLSVNNSFKGLSQIGLSDNQNRVQKERTEKDKETSSVDAKEEAFTEER